MGTSKLWLLVLLINSGALAQDDGTQGQSCLKDATRFKHLRKYVYNYEAETSNGVPGTADSQSGSKITCTVELEVPQLCSFILRVSQCTLREVYGVNSEGKAILRRSKNSDEFASALAKHELKFSIPDGDQVLLFPEQDETVNVLNIKRGIISALVVPVEKDEAQTTASMDTVYGKCSSEVAFKNKKDATATMVTIDRNLKTCNQFTPLRDHVSPLALIKGLNTPLSTLISSSQSCQYTIDARRKHVSDAVCTEKHLFLPFSHKNQYGIMAQVTQTLKLVDTPKINSRIFEADSSLKQGLALEKVESKSPVQKGDDVVKVLQELQKLSGSQQQRANLFHKFVTGLRGLQNATLSSNLPALMDASSAITLQALAQCGTPECFSVLLQALRSQKMPRIVADAVTYSLGFLASPSASSLVDLLNMARYLQSGASFYGLSHAVNNFYEKNNIATQEVKDVADFMASLIDNECSGNQDKTYLTLKAIGKMGKALDAASPALKQALQGCVRSQTASLSVQKAAIQAFRKMPMTDEVRGTMLQAFLDSNSPVEKRLAAYLLLMKDPAPSDLTRVTRSLLRDKNEQVRSFVASHIANILRSAAPEAQELKGKILEALKGSEVPSAMDFRKFSQNYQISKSITVPGMADAMGAKIEANLIFDGIGYMPEESMLQATLNVFGKSHDMFEFGLDGKGFEPTLDALFGEKGFFPDSGMKALYWVDGKVPEKVSAILFKWFGVSRTNGQNQDFARGIMANVEKLMKEVRASDAPEAKAYLRILGEELGYLSLSDVKAIGNLLLDNLPLLHFLPPMVLQALAKKNDADLFAHYIFMDNDFDLPTGAGFQLQVSLSGIVTPGVKAGLEIRSKGAQSEADVTLKPTVAVEFVTHLGVYIPEFAQNGVEMNTNIFHESGGDVNIAFKQGQVKLSIPSPKRPVQLLSFSNKLHLVSTFKTEPMTSIIQNRESWSSCKPLFTGLKYCTNVGYSNASSIDAAPYYPLTGETRFELEIQPTGEVTQYTASANYDLVKEDGQLIDTLTFTAQAEGSEPAEGTLAFKYNRNKITLSTELQVPKFDVDFGVGLRVNDESTRSKTNIVVIFDVNNHKVPEISLTGRMKYDGKRDVLLEGVFAIPRLQVEARSDALLMKYSGNQYRLQLDSSAAVGDLSTSSITVFTYDNDNIAVDWTTDSNSDLKKMISKIPAFTFADVSDYTNVVEKYANDVLDHKVANTDMTLRHIVSQSIVASNNWLQKTSKDMPYAAQLQEKLSGLQELNFKKMGLPEFTIPEQLFLKSNGNVQYVFNKDSIEINIPLLLNDQARVPPHQEMQQMTMQFDTMQADAPSATVPQTQTLRLPMIGVLSLSTNLQSNYYNWSASCTAGNYTRDMIRFSSDCKMQADSVVDLLSYKMAGAAELYCDALSALGWSVNGNFHHSLLDSSMKAGEKYNKNNNPQYEYTIEFDATSKLGAQGSVSSTVHMTSTGEQMNQKYNTEGQLKVGPLFARVGHAMTVAANVPNLEVTTESNLKLDSSYLQATNKITSQYTNDVLNIASTSDVQNGALTNTISLSWKPGDLTLKCDTAGRYQNVAALNKNEMSLRGQVAAIRSEYNADYNRNRLYALISSSLSPAGLELNTDIGLTNQANRAGHKGTLEINGNGLSTSATTNVNFNPLTMGSDFSAGIDASGATLKMAGNGRYRQNNAKFTVDGKAALTEVTLGSTYQSTILGMDSKNKFNFRIDKDGLVFSNNLLGSYEEMKLVSNHDLSLALSALRYISKFEGTLSAAKTYKQSFDLQMQPYTVTASLDNEFKYGDVDLTNKGQLLLEPFKMNLNGNMKGAYRKDEIKHNYVVTYADLTAAYRTDTTANIQNSAYTHSVNVEIAGLSASFSCNTNYACKSLRFTNVVRSVVAPFKLTVDAHTTGDGRMAFLGEHTGELYSKFLLKAEPLAFSLSHDYRGSTGHICGPRRSQHSTLVDNKVKILFTPSEQLSSWKLKTNVDKNGYSQEVNLYNDVEKIGVELSGQALADFSLVDVPVKLDFWEFNPVDSLGLRDTVDQPQEFSISGSVKYDKNKDVHVINFPFLESLPIYFEQLRGFVLSSLESLQDYLKGINIDQVIKKYRSFLDKFPPYFNDFMNRLDIESSVNDAKAKLIAFTKEYTMTAEDLEKALENAKINFQSALGKLQDSLSELNEYLRRNIDIYELRSVLENIINEIIEKVKNLDKQYDISKNSIKAIQELQIFVNELDVNELSKAASTWAHDINIQYKIKENIVESLQEIKSQINNINSQKIAAHLKKQLQELKLEEYVEKLKDSIPTEQLSALLDKIKHIVFALLEDYEVAEKINAFAAEMQNLIVRYEVDKHAQALMDKFMKLANQYKVKETVRNFTTMLKNIDFKSFFDQIAKSLEAAIEKLKSYDAEKFFQDLSQFLDEMIKKIRSFDYMKFVDQANERIREVTKKINDAINQLELPQKAEVLKEYMNDVSTIMSGYMEKIGESKLAEIVDWYRNLLSVTTINELKKRAVEFLEQVRDAIYRIDLRKESQHYLQHLSNIYIKFVKSLVDGWNKASDQVTAWGAEYDMNNFAEKLKTFIEHGLQTLMEATFQIPSFTVPLTDLKIPAVTVNMKKLREFAIPTKFNTPEFTILQTYTVPSYTIDLNEIKRQIVRIIDQMMSSEFQWPLSNMYLNDLKMKDIMLADISFPEIHFPEIQLPIIVIPKLNLNDFQFPNIEIPEFQLPKIPHTVTVPTFGKLAGELKVVSPFFTLTSSADVQNTTISDKSPEFLASLSAQTTSKFELIAFTLVADARISAPRMAQMIFRESVKLSHKFAKLDHSSEVTFSGSYAQGKIETLASLHTEKNTAQLHNDILLKLQKKITIDVNTRYSHKINLPEVEFSSQLELQNELNTLVEAGKIALLSAGKGNWKWACPEFSDEGTHESSLKFIVKDATIEISGSNKINDKYVKLDQSLKYESGLLSFVTFEVQSEADSQYVGRSVFAIQGNGQLDELKMQLTATHNAELAGRATGTISNSLSFLVQPFEINLSTNHNGNFKVAFPMKLTGKIEFLNNYALVLNSGTQQVSWQVNGRFNQYKYSHTISSGNNEDNINARIAMNGEANLDFLNVPISIPELPIPYTSSKTPAVKDFSLWERTGLKDCLKTTKQSFDLNVNTQYRKNKDMHAIPFPLGTLYDSINQNMKYLNKHFEKERDHAIATLTDSYNKAKADFEKYKVDNSVNKAPRIFRISGYTIPIVNIEVSPFTAELPAFGYVVPKEIRTPSFVIPFIGFSVPTYTLVLPSLEMPVLHVPGTLRRLTLPRFKLPDAQNEILIPALGDLTYDFTFKSNVISLTTTAGLYNQSDISARISSSCTSVIEALQYKLDGTTSLTRQRGLKLATALSLTNAYLEGNHESSVTFSKKNIEALVTTTATVNAPVAKINFKQELSGNTKSKPTIASKINLNYDLNDGSNDNIAKGTVDNTFNLEGLSNYFSIETTTKGDISGLLLKNKFSGKFNKELNAFLNADGMRSTMKYEGNSKCDGIGNTDIKENLAIEASLRRIYAVWEHTGKNNLRHAPWISSKGTQNCKATLEIAPWSFLANAQLQVNQPNMIIEAVSENIALSLTFESQKFESIGECHISSVVLAHEVKLANDNTEARMDVAGSVQGHVAFLKSIVLPVYDKSLWDILKFDVTTDAKKMQYFNNSASIVYSKNKEGFFFAIPVEKLADGVVITIPQLNLEVPQWMKAIPGKARAVQLTSMPLTFVVPEFTVPFTNLQVPSYTFDFSQIKVPKKLPTMPFDLKLPALPTVRFPKVDVGARYLMLEEYKIPYFEVTVPKFELTIPEYTIPKRFEGLDLNAIAKKIAEFELPTITIPEHKIEFPPLKLNLPAGIFIPAFGALSGSIKMATPIYTVSWSAALKNATNVIEASVDLTSSSTLQFLEYDLDAAATAGIEGGKLKLAEKGTLAHLDLSAEWTGDLTFDGLRMPRHSLRVDITSPTFTDVQVRCLQEGGMLSSYVSSPSAGTLGLLLEKDATAIKAKVYSRTPSAPGKDVNILKGELSLKNPEQLQIKTNWKEEAAADILNGVKVKLPKMSDAIYNFIDKYHNEHMGMDIKSASMKMKSSLENNIEAAHKEAARAIDDAEQILREAVRNADDKYQSVKSKAGQMYQDQAATVDYRQIRALFIDTSINIIKEYQKQIKNFIDAAIKFLKVTKFQLPGHSKQYTGEELYTMAMDNLIQGTQRYFDALIQYVSQLEVTVPGTETRIQGKQVIEQIKEFLKQVQQIAKKTLSNLQKINWEEKLKEINSFLQNIFEKVQEMFGAVKNAQFENFNLQAQEMYRNVRDSEYSRQLKEFLADAQMVMVQIGEVSRSVLQSLSEKLEHILAYLKALRADYIDPNIVGWSVKYYEIEEKVGELLQQISLRDFYEKYIVESFGLLQELINNIIEFLDTNGKEYYEFVNDLVTDAEGKGRKKMAELSTLTQDKIRGWSTTFKDNAAEYRDYLNAKLQDAHIQLSASYERFIAEAGRLIELTIEKYNAFIEYIMQLLQNIQTSATDSVKPYISTRKGELKVDVPHPFKWQSFNELPQLRDDVINKKMEIVRQLIQQGVDESSKKWEELQRFIDQQLAEGKLSVQQIMENLQQRM